VLPGRLELLELLDLWIYPGPIRVDELLRHVEAVGGTLTAPAHMRPFGV
jgi:hypothetical protein